VCLLQVVVAHRKRAGNSAPILLPETLSLPCNRYLGGKEVVQDSQGKMTPNPYVYLYLGPCSSAQRQQQVSKQGMLMSCATVSTTKLLKPWHMHMHAADMSVSGSIYLRTHNHPATSLSVNMRILHHSRGSIRTALLLLLLTAANHLQEGLVEQAQHSAAAAAAAACEQQLQQHPQQLLQQLQELHHAPLQHRLQHEQQQAQLSAEHPQQLQQMPLVTEQQQHEQQQSQQQQAAEVPASKRPRLQELQPGSQPPDFADAHLLQELLAHADEQNRHISKGAAKTREQQEQRTLQEHHQCAYQQQHGNVGARSSGALTELDPNLLSPQAARLGPVAAARDAVDSHHMLGRLAGSSSVDGAVRAMQAGQGLTDETAAAGSSKWASNDNSKGRDDAAQAGAAAEPEGAAPTAGPATAAAGKGKSSDPDMRQVSCSNLECAICKDLLAAAHLLACGHWYCGVCLAQWLELRQEPSCPSCRAAVKSECWLIAQHVRRWLVVWNGWCCVTCCDAGKHGQMLAEDAVRCRRGRKYPCTIT
jgi:hypothetical protein